MPTGHITIMIKLHRSLTSTTTKNGSLPRYVWWWLVHEGYKSKERNHRTALIMNDNRRTCMAAVMIGPGPGVCSAGSCTKAPVANIGSAGREDIQDP